MAIIDRTKSKIPFKYSKFKDLYGNVFYWDAYDLRLNSEDEIDIDDSEIRVYPEVGSWNKEVLKFKELDGRFELTSSKLVKLIEKYEMVYEESKVIETNLYDEDGRRLTKKDWEERLERLQFPRDNYEERAVVSSIGTLFINAATALKAYDKNPKRGNELYQAVEKKKKFIRQFWRYATEEEIEREIAKFSEED